MPAIKENEAITDKQAGRQATEEIWCQMKTEDMIQEMIQTEIHCSEGVWNEGSENHIFAEYYFYFIFF